MVHLSRERDNMNPGPRLITQIAIGNCEGSPFVVALCNDGTAWKLMHDDRWAALPRIPQGEAPDVGPRKGAVRFDRLG